MSVRRAVPFTRWEGCPVASRFAKNLTCFFDQHVICSDSQNTTTAIVVRERTVRINHACASQATPYPMSIDEAAPPPPGGSPLESAARPRKVRARRCPSAGIWCRNVRRAGHGRLCTGTKMWSSVPFCEPGQYRGCTSIRVSWESSRCIGRGMPPSTHRYPPPSTAQQCRHFCVQQSASIY